MAASVRFLVASSQREADALVRSCFRGERVIWKGAEGYRWAAPSPEWGTKLVVTGSGPRRAYEGLAAAILQHGPASCVVGYGVSGGLIKTSEAGHLVIPTEVLMDRSREVPTEWLRMRLSAFAPEVRWRTLITEREVVSTPAEKAALWAATSAEAVDMESASWAAVCRERQIPWAVVRGVLDPGDSVLPRGLSLLTDAYGRVLWGRTASYFAMHPSAIGTAWRISREWLPKASHAFVDVLEKWLLSERQKA